MSGKEYVLKVLEEVTNRNHGEKEFLDAVTPLYGVISIGASKLPADDTLLRLQESGTTVYRTDLNGNIFCSSDGYTLSFETEQTTTEDSNG